MNEPPHAARPFPDTSGDGNPLLEQVYDQLRKRAARMFPHRREETTLQPTALVHEAWARLADTDGWTDREHFVAVATKVMRQVLVDHARARNALRRGGGLGRVTLSALDEAQSVGALCPLELDEALHDLGRISERYVRVVELRYFGGLAVEEIAALLEVTPRTVNNDWRAARAWLRDRLET